MINLKSFVFSICFFIFLQKNLSETHLKVKHSNILNVTNDKTGFDESRDNSGTFKLKNLPRKKRKVLKKLKTKKRLWFMFEESRCQLLYYHNEREALTKTSLGHIDIGNAVIFLDLDQANQFVVMCRGKEYIFSAENHEAMMIWLIGLQAKRNAQSAQLTAVGKNLAAGSEDDLEKRTGIEKQEAMLWEVHQNNFGLLQQKLGFAGKKELSSVNESIILNEAMPRNHLIRMRSLPPVCEGVEIPKTSFNRQLSKSYDLSFVGTATPAILHIGSSESIAESDDVFLDDSGYPGMDSFSQKSRILRKMNTVVEDEDFNLDGVSGDQRTDRNSVSSDSAIGKEVTTQELSARQTELEKELMIAKCDLAKSLNQLSCFEEILKRKDALILKMDENIDELTENVQNAGKKSSYMCTVMKEMEENMRVLRNQNRFLNEEIKKLAKIQEQEKHKFDDQHNKIRIIGMEIYGWKKDYVSLVQSSIRFSGNDVGEDAELSLYNADHHKQKVRKLLDEARMINPSLPTFDMLANNEIHVDAYGFKHSYSNTGLLLHYVCQQIYIHYAMLQESYEEHQLHWKTYLQNNSKLLKKNLTELKQLCRTGISDQYRKQVWRHLIYSKVHDLMEEKGPHYFSHLCNLLPESQRAAGYRKQISLDLLRTIPNNVKFSSPGSKGIMDLQDVLLAFCIHNPSVGYCQGMNFIVGMCLIFMDAHDAFWTLVAISERYFSSHYFNHNLIGAQADQNVLKEMLRSKLPRLCQHLEEIDIELSTVTLNWFMAIFFDAVPFQTLLRIWDCFLLEGPKVLFRFSLAILKMHEKDLLQKLDTISVMRHLKSCAKVTFDADGLMKIAFEELKPFPRRQTIFTKQTYYLNTLKERYEKQALHKMTFIENKANYLYTEVGLTFTIQAACCYQDGKVWFWHGEQSQSKAFEVDCTNGTMVDLSIKVNTEILCLTALSSDIVLLGTLSWMVYAYHAKSRQQLWEVRLHDAVLTLCSSQDDKGSKVFAGLADGTIAVIEDASSSSPQLDILYIPISLAPVTCLLLVSSQLWCSSANKVHILHSSTLDTLDKFTISANIYDHVLSMKFSVQGVWIAVKGSSIVEMWDPESLTCKLMFDTKSGKYPCRKNDDGNLDECRVTAILPYEDTIFVGTGNGNLIIYGLEDQWKTEMSSVNKKNVNEAKQHKTAMVALPRSHNFQRPLNEAFFRDLQKDSKEIQKLQENTEEMLSAAHVKRTQILQYLHNQSSSQETGEHSSFESNDTEYEIGDRQTLKIVSPLSNTGDGSMNSGKEQIQSGKITESCNVNLAPGNQQLETNNNTSSNNCELNFDLLFNMNHDYRTSLKKVDSPPAHQTKLDPFADGSSKNWDPGLNESLHGPHFKKSLKDCKLVSKSLENFPLDTLNTRCHYSESREVANQSYKYKPETFTNDEEISLQESFEACCSSQENGAASRYNSLDCPLADTETKSINAISIDTLYTENKEQRFTGMTTEHREQQNEQKLEDLSANHELRYRLEFSGVHLNHDFEPPLNRLTKRARSEQDINHTLSTTDSLYINTSSDDTEMDSKTSLEINDLKKLQYSSIDTSVSIMSKLFDFLNTPSLTPRSSLSSLRSTKSQMDISDIHRMYLQDQKDLFQSHMSVNLNCIHLNLIAKVKISDKPVSCLLMTRAEEEPVILSFSGCFTDDEPVLNWRKVPNEKIWSNKPIIEISVDTKTPKQSVFVRRFSTILSTAKRFDMEQRHTSLQTKAATIGRHSGFEIMRKKFSFS